MSVVAKMRCVEVSKSTDITGVASPVKVRLQAVYGAGEDDANKSWSKWTPSGELMMAITNPEASDQFKVGACYRVTMAPFEE